MKRFKLLICLAVCLISSLSFLLFSPFIITANASVESFDGVVKKSQSSFLTVSALNTNLYYSDSATTSNLYTVKITGGENNTSTTTYSFDNGQIVINACSSFAASWKAQPRLETAFRLDSKFDRAVNNNLLNITFNTQVSNSYISKTTIGFQSGTISINGASVSWLGSGEFSKTSVGAVSDENVTLSYKPTKVGENTDIILVVDNEKNSTWYKSQVIKLNEPKITLSSTRQGGPEISNVKINGKDNDTSWTNYMKPITFTVQDNDIGIDYVTINGNKIDCDEETKNSDTLKTFTYIDDSNESFSEKRYNIVAYDYLGGTTTLTKVVNNVDLDDVSDITTDVQKGYHEKNFDVNISFTEQGISPENVYYLVVDKSSLSAEQIEKIEPDIFNVTDEVSVYTDVTGKTKKVNYQNGKDTLKFNFENDGDYILSLLICDDAGHKKVINKEFSIDSVKRRINVVNHNGIYNLTGDVYKDELGFYTWKKGTITVDYFANENFEFYEFYRNGSKYSTNGQYYTYTFSDADLDIEIFNRFVININPVTSYEFCNDNINLNYELNTNYFIDAVTTEELSSILNLDVTSLTKEEILVLLNQYIKTNLIFTIVYNNFETENIFNKGLYKVNYSLDTNNFIANGSFDVEVNAKALTVLYDEQTFVYNGSVQEFVFEQIKGQNITCKYYYVCEDGSLIETVFKDAGNYKIVLELSDENFELTNGEIFISINKKQINANVGIKTFKYNTTAQNIEYSLSENINSFVNYYITSEDGEKQEANFINSGKYSFEILPEDATNYEVLGGVGDCEILKIIANITVNNFDYNYTGAEQTLDYVITDENNNLVSVNGLKVIYTINNEVVPFTEPNKYNFAFSTSDYANYELGGILNGEVTIKQTIIKVYVTNFNYEYTGSIIELNYYFEDEDDNLLTNLNNINIVFTKDGAVADFKDCGEYSYEIVTKDINYKVEYMSSQIVTIDKAILNVDLLQRKYEYCALGLNLNYRIISNTNVDFSNNSFIKLSITKLDNNEEVTLNNVGMYSYVFTSSNPNIVLYTGDISGQVEVVAKQVILSFVPNYVYNENGNEFIYSLSEEIEVIVEIDSLLNVGVYPFLVSSVSNNYVVINNEDNFVTVSPKTINLESIEKEYEYTAENINVLYSLAEDIEVLLSYTKIDDVDNNTLPSAKTNNDRLLNIINAGKYNMFITPTNSNYIVDTTDIIITITPKQVEINVTNNVVTYNAQQNFIEVNVNGGLNEDVTYEVSYLLNGNIVDAPIFANTYNYVVQVNNSNYVGSAEGEFVINKAVANLIVTPDQNKVYGDTSKEEYNYTLTGVLGSDIINITLSREIGENVGYYSINKFTADNENYEINFTSARFKIVARKLIVMAKDSSKTFEDEVEELPYVITYGETVNNEKLLGSLSRETGEDVGVYKIGIGSLQDSNPNYKIVFKDANFTIKPKNLTFRINNIETEYGIEAPLSITPETANYNPIYITGDIVREGGSDVGEYKITKGTLESKNYNLIVIDGTYTIKPKKADIIVTSSSKTYGDEDNITFNVTGLINNDILQGTLGREVGEDVGSYEINLGTIETLNTNYKFNLTAQNFIINKALITITIDDKTQIYGEEEKPLTYSINGLKLNDEINFKLFRESGSDVGEYIISCGLPKLNNYYVLLNSGIYTILKAKAKPVLMPQITTYNGEEQSFNNTSFPYPLQYSYKRNGINVDSVKNAGTYIVQAYFAGNNNYEEATSNAVSFTINKVSVCFSLGTNTFVYNGEVKYPEFTFDNSIGLSQNAVIYEIENNVTPIEVGEYNFTISVKDDNFEGFARGKLTITKPISIVTDFAVLECDDAVYNQNLSNIKLVSTNFNRKLANKQVLQSCAFENIDNIEKGHVFTVRMRANSSNSNVYVYKIDKNNVASEIVVSIQDGFYVFKVDGLDCEYVIAADIEPMSLIAVAGIIGASILVLVSIVIAFKVRKSKKKKLALKLANGGNEQLTEEVIENEIQNNNIEQNSQVVQNDNTKAELNNKNVRIDNIVSSALNNGAINTNTKSILDVDTTKSDNSKKQNNDKE